MPNSEIITLEKPIYAICRNFIGTYINTAKYISEMQSDISELGIPKIHDSGLSILLDNPLGKSPLELRSICGVLIPEKVDVPEPYFILELSGKYLHTRSEGTLPDIRLPAYQSLLNYIIDEQVVTETGERIEIIRKINTGSEVEIYVKVKE